MDYPVLDLIAKFSPLIGWTMLVGISWRLRGVVEEKVNLWKDIDIQTKAALVQVAVIKDKVDTLQTTHMAGMQKELESLTKSNDKAVEVLQNINSGIKVLVDRGTRETIVETKIRHVTPGIDGEDMDKKE